MAGEQQRRGLYEVVHEEDDEIPQPHRQNAVEGAATSMLLLALAALSKRTVIALESCFTLITVGLVFWAALSVLNAPNTNQLVGLGIFSAFVLIANWLVLKRRG